MSVQSTDLPFSSSATTLLGKSKPDFDHMSHEQLVAIANRQWARIANLEDSVRVLEEKNRHLILKAFYDQLTGLSNRPGSELIALDMIREACRDNIKLGVMMFDLDNFKAVNDILGHKMGDWVLETVGAIVRAKMRATDNRPQDHLFGRQGGDEHLGFMRAPQNEAALSEFIKRTHIGNEKYLPAIEKTIDEIGIEAALKDPKILKYIGIETALKSVTAALNEKVSAMLAEEDKKRGRPRAPNEPSEVISADIDKKFKAGVLKVGVSFGGLLFNPEELKSIYKRHDEDWLRAALNHNEPDAPPETKILGAILELSDKALYVSKRGGRGRSTLIRVGGLNGEDAGDLPYYVRRLANQAEELDRQPTLVSGRQILEAKIAALN